MTGDRWSELLALTNAQLEGELCDEDAERLALWLSIDDEAQSHYVRALQLHAALMLEFLDFKQELPVNNRPLSLPSSGLSLTSTACRPAADLCSLAPRPDRSTARIASRSATLCRWVSSLSGSVAIACCAFTLAVVAVYGSERLFFKVLSARRASTADQAGGMIVSEFRDQANFLMSHPNTENGTRRIGSSKHEGVALASVYLFPLPPIREIEHLESATLEWTYKRKDGDPQFSVDLYGLGFVTHDSQYQIGFWEGPAEEFLQANRMATGSDKALIKRSVITPQTPLGRIAVENRSLLRFLQTLYDHGAREGDLAIFRLNADCRTSQIARETGYAVVHPPSLLELTSPSELPCLTVTAKSQRQIGDQQFAQAVMATHAITEHWSGGVIRSFNNLVQSGCNADGTRRIGSSFAEGVGLVNVFVFSLPAVERIEDVISARLQWTLASKDNAPRFSVDLYGLGYLRGDSYHGPCFWEGKHDQALPADYGLQGRLDSPVSLIARRVMNPSTPCGPVIVENSSLIGYLRSLYQAGAQEGDLVVFRLNVDISTLDIARGTGYSVIHAPVIEGRTTDSDLPILQMTVN